VTIKVLQILIDICKSCVFVLEHTLESQIILLDFTNIFFENDTVGEAPTVKRYVKTNGKLYRKKTKKGPK
jgi:hypothetical protein